MPNKRTPSRPTKHDQKTSEIARQLKGQGWRVKADLPGYEQSDPIGKDKRIPDIEARKRGATRLVEVETPDTLGRDKDQQSTFRRSAAQRERTTFRIEVTE